MPDPEVARLTEEWLRYAREDIAAAQAGLDARDVRTPRHVCFDAQQAAEKAVKAVFVARQVQFAFTHDLEELVALLEEDHVVRRAADDLQWLSQWAVAPRYPGDVEPDWNDAERAVRLAAEIVDAASEAIT